MGGDKPGEKITARRRVRRSLRRVLIVLPIVLIVGVGMLAGMEYYTGRSDFCGSCHIMIPYYNSWKKDVHATKVGAGCVDCHYAPGEQHTIKAKLRGLSQLVSYVSGRAGSTRPRPRVQDASCLRAGCHTAEAFMEMKYPIRDVTFTHAKHMKADPKVLAQHAAKLSRLTAELKALDRALFDDLQSMAVRVGDPEKIQSLVHQRVRQTSVDPTVAEMAADYVSAAHLDVRLKQLGNLRCTTCHAHNDDDKHFSVRRQTCYLCHFVNQQFNTDTARCLNCHEPPTLKIPVHGGAIKVSSGIRTAASGTMDHTVIVANDVNCVSCHADLVSGTGRVMRQRCSACHDLPRYYEDFDHNLNIHTVASLHTVHTSNLHAMCADCHDDIDHRLQATSALAVKADFFEPVLENCAHCHPNHHRGQVELLAGKAEPPIPGGMPNAMFGSRVNCLGCHIHPGTDPKGGTVLEATKQSCVICHSEDYDKLFNQWISRLEAGLKDAGALEARARTSLERLGSDHLTTRRAATKAIADGHAAVAFVDRVKGIHNRNYALELLEYASDQFNQAIVLIEGPPSSTAPGTKPSQE